MYACIHLQRQFSPSFQPMRMGGGARQPERAERHRQHRRCADADLGTENVQKTRTKLQATVLGSEY